MKATGNHAIAFDEIVAAWTRMVNCEATTQTGMPCRRPASWRINLHGCERAVVCGQHLRTWKRDAAGSTGRCAHCGLQFDTITAAYTVAPL